MNAQVLSLWLELNAIDMTEIERFTERETERNEEKRQ